MHELGTFDFNPIYRNIKMDFRSLFYTPGSQVCFDYSQLQYQIGNIAWELAKTNSQTAELSGIRKSKKDLICLN